MIVTSQTQQILIEHDTYSKNVFFRKIKANIKTCSPTQFPKLHFLESFPKRTKKHYQMLLIASRFSMSILYWLKCHDF